MFCVSGAFYWTTFERAVGWYGEAASLDELLDNWASLGPIPGVILRVDGPAGLVYHNAAGSLTKSGTARLTPRTPFHTASVSKLFTAATVLRLHELGAVDINHTAASYIGDEEVAGLVVVDGEDLSSQITLRQLLSHRGGLGNTDDDLLFGLWILSQPSRRRTPGELLNHARRIGAVGRPGEKTSYASPGYFLLGRVIEAATGAAYHQAVRETVLERLGMSSTFEATHEWRRQEETLHHYAGWVDFSQFDPSFEFADGGYVTTASDLTRFGKALASGALFDDASTQQLFLARPSGESIALGPHIHQQKDGTTVISHSGYWSVLLVVYPEEDIVASMTLAQSTASLFNFWSQAREILARDYGLPR